LTLVTLIVDMRSLISRQKYLPNINYVVSVYGFPRRNIFIDSETTPNPHSMKFKPGREVLSEEHGTGMYFQSNGTDSYREISKSPLAKALFSVSGVKSVFLGRDFITITKQSDESWLPLKPQLFSAIMDFFAENKPVMTSITQEGVSDTTILDTDDEIVATIKELMETRIRPSVQEDGGDIFYEGFDPITGLVKVYIESKQPFFFLRIYKVTNC